jgi:hypothetical protein
MEKRGSCSNFEGVVDRVRRDNPYILNFLGTWPGYINNYWVRMRGLGFISWAAAGVQLRLHALRRPPILRMSYPKHLRWLRRASSPKTTFASSRSPMLPCCTRATIRASSRGPLSSKRLPMSWAWKEHRPLRPHRRTSREPMLPSADALIIDAISRRRFRCFIEVLGRPPK